MSSFFEPTPPRKPPRPRVWGPPAWDRPSEGTLPSILPIEEIVAQTDEAVVEVESLGVYPNGLHHQPGDARQPPRRRAPRWPHDAPRSGPRFRHRPHLAVAACDRRALRRRPLAGSEAGVIVDVDKDEDGFPTQPILRMTGGGPWRVPRLPVRHLGRPAPARRSDGDSRGLVGHWDRRAPGGRRGRGPVRAAAGASEVIWT